MQCGGLDDPFPIQVFRRRLAIRQYWSGEGGPDLTLSICPPFDERLCNVLLDPIAPVPDVPTAASTAALQSAELCAAGRSNVALVRGQAWLNAVPLRIFRPSKYC